jgi:hypothetical protein
VKISSTTAGAASLAIVLVGGPISGAGAAAFVDQDVASIAGFGGTGFLNCHFDGDRTGTIELGLRAQLRTVGPIVPVGTVYTAPAGPQTKPPAQSTNLNRAAWNIDFSALELGGTNTFTSLTLKIVDNITGKSTTLDLISSGLGPQNSENLDFAFLATPLAYNFNDLGTYDFTLSASDTGGTSSSAEITVDVVSEPGTAAEFGLALLGLGMLRRRKTA